MFETRGALHLNVLMNISYVPLQILSVEHLRAERAMLAHIIMNFFDVCCQMPRIELLWTERAMFAHIIMNFFDVPCQGVERHFFSASGALFLDSRVGHLHVLCKLGRPYLLRALGALSCVALVSSPNMAFYPRGVDHFVAINALYFWLMDAFEFDVHGEIPRCTESFTTLRTLVGHLITSCST